MKVPRFRLLLSLCGLIGIGLAGTAPNANADDTGDVLVQLQQNVNVQQFASAFNAFIKAKTATANTFVLTPKIKISPSVLAAAMSIDTRVASAAPNYIGDAVELAVRTAPQWTAVFDGGDGLNFYANQYAVAQVNYNRAAQWANGSGVIVAVLDTGISVRPAGLAAQTLTGWNFVDGNSDTDDRPYNLDSDGNGVVDEGAGHGTMIAGLVTRFAPRVSLLPVRVLNSDGRGTLANVVDGVNYAVARGAKVLSLSFGFSQNSTLLTNTLANARKKGVLVVCAAGNANSAILLMPAGTPGGLTVAGVDGNNQKASFSNYGKGIDVCAPAVNVTSTYWDGRYASWSGTSFAAPIVAAQAALLFSSASNLNPDAVRNAIIESSHNLNTWNPLYLNLLGGKDGGLIDFDASFSKF